MFLSMEKATSGELLWKLGEKGKEKQGNNEAFVTLSISLHSRWAEFLVL